MNFKDKIIKASEQVKNNETFNKIKDKTFDITAKSVDKAKDIGNELLDSAKNFSDDMKDNMEERKEHLEKEKNDLQERLKTHQLNDGNSMYLYAKYNKLGKAVQDDKGVQGFIRLEKELETDEYILLPFIGLHDFESLTKHKNQYAYVYTNKRLLAISLKKEHEEKIAINKGDIMDIVLKQGKTMNTVSVFTKSGHLYIGVSDLDAKAVFSRLKEVYMQDYRF